MNSLLRMALVSAILFASLGSSALNAGVLDQWINRASAEPLPPEQAFSVQARRLDTQRIALDFAMPSAYYLYKDRMLIALKDTPGLRIAALEYPPAIIKQDPYFGPSPVYQQPFRLLLTLSGPGKGPIKILTRYQGCFETRGLCYPPQSKVLTLP